MTLPSTINGDNWSQRRYYYIGPTTAGVSIPTGVADNNKLNGMLLQKAKGNQWNVPVFLAEGRKTVDMVVNTATRLVHMGLALRRGRLDRFFELSHPSNPTRIPSKSLKRRFGKAYAKDPFGAFGDYWLQLKYGWLPFMSDCRNAVNTLMDTADRPDSRYGSVRSSYSQMLAPVVLKNTKVFSDSGREIWGDNTVTGSDAFRAVWRYTINPLDVPGRFGLLNPAEVIYELVPLSFVADWFVPIGDYLAALDAPLRFSHLGGTYGYRGQRDTRVTPKHMVPTGGSFTGFSGNGTYIAVKRTSMSSIPSLSLAKMRFDPQLGASRIVTSVALLNQLFRK